MSRRRPSRFHGLLPVYKKSGPTSHDVVDMARKALGERRIGHTGTLDPMAEGLLLLCVGQATRLQQFLLHWDKTYRGQIKLGTATATYDGEGDPQEPQGAPPELDQETIERLQSQFSGTIQQVPPPYSAKKVAGKKLYELARNGEEVLPEPKTVTVHDLGVEVSQADVLTVEARTSTGFYVRSLAHDIGCTLGCGGYLQNLERLSIGPYTASDALDQELLQKVEDPDQIIEGQSWIPIERAALPFPEIDLNLTAAERFTHGQEVVVFRPSGDPVESNSYIVVRGQDKRLLGVGSVRAVLARGRTLNIAPSVVLDMASRASQRV
jgi:tRNA pseudouridine55 synthase